MRVLVTRPIEEARRTAAQLEAVGHEAILAPMTQITPAHVAIPNDPFAAIMATSAQALKFTCLPDLAAPVKTLPLFAVGERTAEAARTAGFSNVRPPVATAVELAEAIGRAMPRGVRLLYVAGRDRKPDLEMRLANSGFQVRVFETYEARAIGGLPIAAQQAIQTGTIDAALHFSRRSAALFVEAVESADLVSEARRLLHGAISKDAAAPLLGVMARIRIAARPTAKSLYETLV